MGVILSIPQVCGQRSGNPFEIIRTNDTLQQNVIDSTRNTLRQSNKSINNAFEVIRDDEPVQQPTTDTIVDAKGAGVEIDPLDSEGDIEPVDTEFELTDDNPFDVSHIPYRRSELKENIIQGDQYSTTSRRPSVIQGGNTSNTFIFWLILFSLLLISIVVNVQRKSILNISKAITNENVLKLTKREENGGMTGHYIILYVIFFINTACFLYLMIKHYTSQSGMRLWLYLFIALMIVYVGRHVCMYLLGRVFDISKDSGLYSFTIMTFNLFVGLCLIPINLVVAFSPSHISQIGLYVGIGLIIMLLLLRLIRGLLIGTRFLGEHMFQFFLYLCTFELAPVLILLRVLSDIN